MFGDGHVQAISDSIQPSIWVAQGTFNTGDIAD
jgi:hypothetical protein